MRRIVIAGVALLALCAGQAWGQSHRVHYTLLEQPPRALPKKILLLPAEITVKEISVGGVPEKVPEWTKQASDNVAREVAALAATRNDFELVQLPELTPEERDLLEEYLGVYFQVAVAAHRLTSVAVGGWEHKRQRFDYTIGDGLSFLKQKSGADAVLMVIGEDVISSSGRKAAFVLAAAMGVGIAMGQSLLSVGVVSLDNGDLLWMHNDLSVSKDLKDAESVREMLKTIMVAYPGLPAPKPAAK